MAKKIIVPVIMSILFTMVLIMATYYPSGLGSLEAFSANINVVSPYNVSATYFLGDGSFLTGVSGSGIWNNVSGTATFDGDVNITGNFTANYLFGNMPWTNLTEYPVACPGSGAITGLNDSVTCSDLWVDVAGDTMTGNLTFSTSGIFNLSYLESLSWSNVSITESQISDLQSYIVNGTKGWNLNFTNIFSNSWANVSITESQVTDLQTYAINGTTGWNLNFTKIFSLDWTNVSITESQISNLIHSVNNTNLNVLDINASSGKINGNLNMSIYNVTSVDCIIFKSGGRVCAGV